MVVKLGRDFGGMLRRRGTYTVNAVPQASPQTIKLADSSRSIPHTKLGRDFVGSDLFSNLQNNGVNKTNLDVHGVLDQTTKRIFKKRAYSFRKCYQRTTDSHGVCSTRSRKVIHRTVSRQRHRVCRHERARRCRAPAARNNMIAGPSLVPVLVSVSFGYVCDLPPERGR
ncbi:hypothetical protein EVAR_12781_1 [Eumeta japonica]|uniref:Uncharacterized protein n=1 Tax=Eumeta variegata TaxID=151549 RepID=A0A4C1UAT3_EUMVA|nr:hypothetical protein EVAR_12781_1 [Eumeta japonica]